jgi:hypothetical protein
VPLENLKCCLIRYEIPTFHETPMFMTAFTTARPPVRILGQINSAHTFLPYFEIHFNITPPVFPRRPFFQVCLPKFLHNSIPSHAYCILRQSQLVTSLLSHFKWTVQLMLLTIYHSTGCTTASKCTQAAQTALASVLWCVLCARLRPLIFSL